MKENIRTALDSIFSAHEVKQRAADEAEDKRRNEEQAFLDAFVQKREGVIRPAMEEIGRAIKDKGHSYDIVTDDGARRGGPSIRFCMPMGAKYHTGYDCPGLEVVADRHAHRVRFQESTMIPTRGGHSGSAGEAPLDDVTPELIQEKILKVVAEVFR
jgi:hypothetical protein